MAVGVSVAVGDDLAVGVLHRQRQIGGIVAERGAVVLPYVFCFSLRAPAIIVAPTTGTGSVAHAGLAPSVRGSRGGCAIAAVGGYGGAVTALKFRVNIFLLLFYFFFTTTIKPSY